MTILFCGCAGLEVEPQGSYPTASSAAGSTLQRYETLHFIVRAQNASRAQQIAEISEQVYKKVMFDANLLSFKPRENYPIVVFRDRFEYQRETGYPAWSGGGAATQPLGQVLPGERETKARTAIHTFEEVVSPQLLAHEISHLVFNEFMEFYTPADSERLRWINEGFATFEEMEALPQADKDDYVRLTRSLVRRSLFSLEKLTAFSPFREPVVNLGSYSWGGRSYVYTNIEVWYWQSRELVSFLIGSGGRFNFYIFLNALKARKSVADAIAEAYPGKWRNLSELEREWKQNL